MRTQPSPGAEGRWSGRRQRGTETMSGEEATYRREVGDDVLVSKRSLGAEEGNDAWRTLPLSACCPSTAAGHSHQRSRLTE